MNILGSRVDRRPYHAGWVVALMLWAGVGRVHAHESPVHWGRDLAGRRTFTVALTLGSVFDLDGEVRETTRPVAEIGGPHSGAAPEDYSWRELGFDDQFPVWGVMMEKLWPFVTLQGHFFTGNPKVSGEADRDYYIGVGSVSFGSQTYDYMVIPEGYPYSGEIDIYSLDLRLLVTPVSFGSSTGVQFTPWLQTGLLLFLANYEIDAGPARGVTQYENPPRDYVIRGRGTGTTGVVVPEFGLGGEMRYAFANGWAFALQGHAAFLRFKGSNSRLGVRSRNEKNLNLDYRSFGARATMEKGLSDRVDLIAGLDFQYWTGDAEIRAKDRPEEDILALREKFDKDAHFRLSALSAFVGLRF